MILHIITFLFDVFTVVIALFIHVFEIFGSLLMHLFSSGVV